MWYQKTVFRLMASWLLLVISGNVQASKVLIWPIDPIIANDQSATTLWIENHGTEPVLMQVRALGWLQEGGNEGYRQQQEVIVSPPIVQVEAGKKQLVRLIKNTPPAARREAAYRILVDEIPKPASGSGIHFQMRYSIPLFVYGDGLSYNAGTQAKEKNQKADALSQPHLSWQLVKAQGKTLLQVTNQGNIHARLSDVRLQQGHKVVNIADGLLGYVLANSTRSWPVEIASSSSAGSLVMRVNSDKEAKPYLSGSQ
ncbi:fimbrial chaperone protein [Serratia fonticola]|uniref:Fimbrial chaperone protein n=1 Tax=Serratia fonticola TaxID=47917 RepID=A0A542BNZ2_SERFO|nr:molecular chaperone [Serratia fonticola]TQI80304.1 fimbrial chaperone protein [Serratia fonticola]TQI97669.1 fimbrial chaperone protein [Serratia fonticola]TVZ72167.1 fimbrial chaperone protein [Serratia fonticola]